VKTFKFRGIQSGDHVCFCWAVSKETFKKIIGEDPADYDKSPFEKGRYKLYLSDILSHIFDLNVAVDKKERLYQIGIDE
jgi:hypothetical protein